MSPPTDQRHDGALAALHSTRRHLHRPHARCALPANVQGPMNYGVPWTIVYVYGFAWVLFRLQLRRRTFLDTCHGKPCEAILLDTCHGKPREALALCDDHNLSLLALFLAMHAGWKISSGGPLSSGWGYDKQRTVSGTLWAL